MHRPEVLECVGVSYPTLWTWIRNGKFPAPIETGDSHQRGRLAWYEDEITAWLDSRPRRKPAGSKPYVPAP
jgi:prophage regulatory protein